MKSLVSTCTTSIGRINHANSCYVSSCVLLLPRKFSKDCFISRKNVSIMYHFFMRSRTPITLMGGICHAEDCRNTKTLTKSVQICLVYKTNPLFWFLSIFISVISVSMYCVHFSMSLIAKFVALHWKRILTGNGSDICHWVGSHIPPPENTNPAAQKIQMKNTSPTEPKNTKEKHIFSYLVLPLFILLLKNCLGISKIIKFFIF